KERNGILISLLAVTLILSQLHATINTLLVFLRQARKVVGSLFPSDWAKSSGDYLCSSRN
ncbi:MAG: hypothetical protein WAU62_07240, partial [Dehalococcoidales bacterium]